jgi:Rps23 Pro-64 3,4-dihydroxylase Tpa1-like proline 4-hydroxylase
LDVAPTGGTLVLFDSVAIPHEVLPTQKGERLAMAGWFHEVQQPFPEWCGT